MPSTLKIRAAAPTRHKLRAILLGGSAMAFVSGGGAFSAGMPTQAGMVGTANTLGADLSVATAAKANLNATVLNTRGTAGVAAIVSYTSTGTVANVNVSDTGAPRTIIDWTSFTVASGNTLNFNFKAASDIVVNRVAGAPITVAAGGAVNGFVGGAKGGNIWFLSDSGVFIQGKVSASGVLMSNRLSLTDVNLLSDDIATLKGELAAAGSLIDLSGADIASGATIDGLGNIVLSAAETVTGDVMLESKAGLAINAPIVAEGAVPVTLAYNSASPTNLTFGNGASLTFANADGTAATSSQGGALSINGQAYTLLYSLAQPGSTGADTGTSDIAGIDANVAAGGDSGFYALGTSVAGTGTAGAPQFNTDPVAQNANGFSGVFEGLGHTVSNFTLGDSTDPNAGLFGVIKAGGVVRDIGLLGGSVNFTATTTTNILHAAGELVGRNMGEVVDAFATGAVSGADSAAGAVNEITAVGGLVGALQGGGIVGSYSTGAVSGVGVAGDGVRVGGLAGQSIDGAVSADYATGTVTATGASGAFVDDTTSGFVRVGGLIGTNLGSVSDSYATGAVLASGGDVRAGGLFGGTSPSGDPGFNADIVDSYASGSVTVSVNTNGGAQAGGLAGINGGAISGSYATGSVSVVASSGSMVMAGGLLGENSAAGLTTGGASVGASYASGPVNVTGTPMTADVGGLVGSNDTGSAISQTYATGAVTGPAGSVLGGLAGINLDTSTIAASAFDTLTTGLAAGIGSDANSQSGGILASTTAALQSGGLAALGFDAGLWGGGDNGLYPFLKTFFPNGVQSVSGFAYADGGLTPLASGTGGAVPVGLTVNGLTQGPVDTGANGYYYFALPAGTIDAANGSLLLSTISANAATGALNAAGLVAAKGTTAGLNLYGGDLLFATPAITYSGSGYAAAVAQAEGYGTTPGFVSGLTQFIQATGAGFTVDTELATTTGLEIQTTGANATLTVANPISIAAGDALTLASTGALVINANLSAVSGVVTTTAGGAISADAAAIAAGSLTGSSSGGASFSNATNMIGTLGPFADTNNGAVTVGDGQALTVTGAVGTGTGTLTLTSTGTISADAAILTVGMLAGTSVGGASFSNSANAIAAFGMFADTANGNVTLTNGQAMTLKGAVDVGTGTLSLTARGAIGGNGARITAGILTGGSRGGASFKNAANAIGTFGGFADTGNGNVTVADAQGLTVTGPVNIGNGALTLAAAGAIAGDTATITAGTLTGSAVGGASFNNAANAIGAFGAFDDTANGNLTVADGQGLTLTGQVNIGTGTLTVAAAGAIAGDAATIAAGTLTGSSAGGASFNNSANAIGTFGGFADTGNGNVTVADGQGLAVTGLVTIGSGTLTLATAGAITGDTATITAGTLTGSSAGGASFQNASNAIGAFGAYKDTGGAVNFSDGSALRLTGLIDASGQALTVSGASTVIEAAGGVLESATLKVAADSADPRGLSLKGFNKVGTITSLSNTGVGGLSFNDDQAVSIAGSTVSAGGGPLTLSTTTGVLTLTGAVSAGTSVLTLNSAATIAADTATLTAATLTGSSVGGASFDNMANAVGTLGTFAETADGNVTLSDGQGLTVTGAVNIGNGSLTLKSAGAIAGDGATITAGALGGMSVGGASFANSANAVGTFGSFGNTTSGALVFTDGVALTASGLSDTAGAITLTTVGAGNNLTLTGAVTATGQTLTLVAAGAIAGDTATIAAGTLTGSSVGGASFDNRANAIGTFGGFADTGNANVTVADGQGLTVTGPVNVGIGTLTLTSAGAIASDTAAITAGTLTGSSVGGASFQNASNAIGAFGAYRDTGGAVSLADGAALRLTGLINASGQALTISGGSTVLEAAGGVLEAATLKVGAKSADPRGLMLMGRNDVGAIVSLSNTGVGGLSFNDDQAVSIAGSTVNAGGGPLTLSTTTGALTLTGAVNAASSVLTVVSAGTITADAATITAGTLTGSSLGGASFNNIANAVGTFGPFADMANGSVTLADSQGLTVSGAVNIGTGTLTLSSAGAIAGDAATITAGTLTGSSVGGASFNNAANAAGALTSFANSTSGALVFTDGEALTVSGLSNTAGPTTLTTVGTGSNLTLAGALTSGGHTLTLVSGGAIGGDAAVISAGMLTGSSVGGASFNNAANAVGAFGGFSDTANGNLKLADGQGLKVTGAVDIGTGILTLTAAGAIAGDTATITAATLTGSSVAGASFDRRTAGNLNSVGQLRNFINSASGALVFTNGQALAVNGLTNTVGQTTLTTLGDGARLTLGGVINASGQTLVTDSASRVLGDGATITAATLTGSSVGGASFANPANAIGTFGGFADTTSGNLTLADSQGLTATGPVTIGAGTLTLTVAGAIAGDGATITAGTLTGSSVGGASFNNALNAIGTFGAFADAAGGNVTLADSRGLMVNGAVNIGTGVLTLVSAGTIAGDGATVTAGTLTGSSTGGTSFNNTANAVGTLGPFADKAGGNLTLADSQSLTVAGAVDTGTGSLSLTAAGAIAGDTATITAGTLTGSSVGGASFNNAANAIGTFGTFADTANGGITVADSQGLTVTGSVSLGTGTLTLGVAGAIVGDTAAITAATLTGSSVGGASFGNAANAVGTLGSFIDTANGDLTLADSRGLTMAGGVNIGRGVLTLTIAGPVLADAATITAGTLTGSSSGGASFNNGGNAIGTFGVFADTANGDVTVADGQGLNVTGAVNIGSGTLNLTTAGAIHGDDASITAAVVTGSSVGGASFDQRTAGSLNAVGTFGGFTNTGSGDVAFTNGQAVTATGLSNLDGNTTLTTLGRRAALTLTGGMTATGATLTLVSSGAIAADGATLSAATLTGSSTGGASFNNGANTIGTLGPFAETANGNVTLADAQGLTVTGAIGLGSGTFTLTTAGAIVGDTATITAATLTGSSVGGASFDQRAVGALNALGTFGGFVNTGAGALVLTDGQALTATGLANTVGAITLTTLAPKAPLTLKGVIDGAGQTLSLVSSSVISADGATISAATLRGSSAGGASFNNSANAIETIGDFVDTANGDLTIANATGLTVSKAIDIGAGNLALSTSKGGLSIGADLTVTGGTIALTAGGAIVQTAGVIQTHSLTGSSVGGASLQDANLIDTMSGFSNQDAGAFSLTNAKSLTVGGVIDNAAGAAGGAGRDVALTVTVGSLSGSGVFLAGRDVAINVVTGAADFASATAGDDLVVRAATGVTVSGALASTGLTSTGDAADTSAAGDALIANAPMTVFGHTYSGAADGSHIDIVASRGDVTIGGGATAAGDVRLQSLTGSVHTADITAGRDILLDAAGAIDAGDSAVNSLKAGGDVAVAAEGGALTLTDAAAGDLIVLRANTSLSVAGNLAAGSTGAAVGAGSYLAGYLPLTLFGASEPVVGAGSVDIGAQSANLAGSVAASGSQADVRVSTSGADGEGPVLSVIGGVTAGQDVALHSLAGSLRVEGAVLAGRDVAAAAGSGALEIGSGRAGGDIVLRAHDHVKVNGSLAAGSAGEGAGAGDTLIAYAPMTVFGHTYPAALDGSHIDILAAGGDLTVVGAMTAAGDVRLQSLSGSIHTAAVNAGRDIVIDAAGAIDSGAAAGNDLTAGEDIAAAAEGGAFTLTNAVAGADLVVRAAAALTASGKYVAGAGGGGASPAAGSDLESYRPLTVFGVGEPALGEGSVDIGASTVRVGSTVTAAGAGADVRVVTTGQDVGGVAALSVIGPVSAGRDVVFDATGGDPKATPATRASIEVGGATTAGRDVAARSTTGSIGLTSVSAGDDIVLVSTAGAVGLNGSATAVGTSAAGAGQTLFNLVNRPLDGLFTLGTQSMFIDGATYANAGYANGSPATLTAGGAIGLALSDPAGVILADNSPAAGVLGSWVKASTVLAPTVTLFETSGGMNIGAATLSGPVTKASLYTSGIVAVTGAFAPVADNSVVLTIGTPDPAAAASVWTPTQIDVVNDANLANAQGAIGATSVSAAGVYSTAPRTFMEANLYARNNVLMGTQAFIDANAKITDINQLKQIDPSRPVPASSANTSKSVMLAAGDLKIFAGNLIVQQNTTGLHTTQGTGYYITRTLTLGSYGANPPAIDLFGVFTRPGTTIPITGPAAADVAQIFLVGALQASPYRGLYRVNSCVIGELGNCTPTSDGITSIPLDELSRGALLSRDELDVEDPTITGAPNEEIWRRPDERP